MAIENIYKHPDGRETKMRLTNERAAELENRLDGSLPEKFVQTNRIGIAMEFVAAAITDGDYEARKKKASAIYDEITEAGGTIIDYQKIILEILKNAGFMTAQRGDLLLRAQEIEEMFLSQKIPELLKAAGTQTGSEK